jgi:uncharacterized protein (TIGR02996 family)
VIEDEAFIRAIVDGPGDDTPRLVYADWLDDRADPRGPYLRAEMEWAKPWRSGERPADSTELCELARGLDPVWVARISRPPVGVCCDHVRFTECGPRLDEPDIRDLAQRSGVKYPEPYLAFLLNYNAGLLTPAIVAPPDQLLLECNPILCFIATRHTYRTPFETIPELETIAGYRRLAGLAPLAYNASTLSDLFIGVTPSNWGQLYSDCAIKPELALGGVASVCAPCLPDYLAGLNPKWAPVRRDQYDI